MKISVVIPCRNEQEFIEECIHAVYACETPCNSMVHVFVVDGMSDDNTRSVVNDLRGKYPTLHLVDNHRKLTPIAFNLGILTGGEVDFVQIVGARHILSPNYLIRCIQKLQSDDSIWCVGGRIYNEYVNREGANIAKAMSTSLGMGIGNFRTLEKSGFTDTVTSPMYPFHVFEKIGFFDEDLARNQDDEFNFRITKAGGKIYYDHEISLKYYVRGNFRGLWRQFFQYGYWKVFVNRKHRSVTTVRQLVPPIFVLYLLLSPFIWLFGQVGGVIAMTPLFVYLVFCAYVSFELEQRKLDLWMLFKSFPILHLSYGLGYLKGIIHFFIVRNNPSEKQKRLSR
jgi:glycosyltransferase involved in cell wall biosynthesis